MFGLYVFGALQVSGKGTRNERGFFDVDIWICFDDGRSDTAGPNG